MRSPHLAIAVIVSLGIPFASVSGQDDAAPATPLGQAPATEPAILHPAEVALTDEGDKGFVYRHFPTGLRLYTFARDTPGRSLCDARCSSAWPPVSAPPGAVPVGQWQIVERPDGRRQWALRGRPIYVRYHDTPDAPAGDGVDGAWHIVGHTRGKQDDPFRTPG